MVVHITSHIIDKNVRDEMGLLLNPSHRLKVRTHQFDSYYTVCNSYWSKLRGTAKDAQSTCASDSICFSHTTLSADIY